MDSKEFVRSIIKDQRSFKLEYFTQLTDRLASIGNAPVESLIQLTQILQESSE